MIYHRQHSKSQYTEVDGNILFFLKYLEGTINFEVCLGPPSAGDEQSTGKPQQQSCYWKYLIGMLTAKVRWAIF